MKKEKRINDNKYLYILILMYIEIDNYRKPVSQKKRSGKSCLILQTAKTKSVIIV
jgi:hypothetical protein